ncbi:MAG TPA: hypothetical protein VNY29_05525 [Terriglobales bacterium]|jgi:hypothetical protein|nr:hypothetical protein [Terriglobales bacterium]
MTATSQVLEHEVNDLVLEQIFAFKEPTGLKDNRLLEYHLRHLRIMNLYHELDRLGWERVSGKA